MTRPKNHKIERVSGQPGVFKASWDFTDSETDITKRNFQVFGKLIDSVPWQKTFRHCTVPPCDSNWSGSDKSDEAEVIPSRYYPNNVEIVEYVEHHTLIGPVGNPDDYYTDIVKFNMSQPLPPKIKVSRDGRKLVYEIDARTSEMSDTSEYYRTKTRFWFQSREYGENWKDIPDKAHSWLSTAGHDGEFTEDKYTYSKPNVVETLTPDIPIMFRLAAINMGPSGCSDTGFSEVHVFNRVFTPVISNTTIYDDRVKFDVVFNNTDEFKVVDAVTLERGEGVDASTVTYNKTISDEKRDDLGSTITMFDSESGQFPSEDKAIFYRVKGYHDSDTENIAYGYASNPVRAGKPKSPSAVSFQQGSTTTVSWTTHSSCSPHYMASLWITYRTGEFRKFESEWIPTDPNSSSMHYTFQDVDTSDTESIDRIFASVSVRKFWGGLAGTVYGDSTASQTGVIPAINEIRLLEDGLSLYVSETHSFDGMDTTEYSWHTRQDGWESNKTPSTYNVSDSTTSSHLIIADLDDGVQYYVRCRRYDSVTKSYGLYSSIVGSMTGSVPEAPVLSARSSVGAGKGIEYTWDFHGGEQTEAIISMKYKIERSDSFVGDGTNDVFTLSVDPGFSQTDIFTGDGETYEFTLSEEAKYTDSSIYPDVNPDYYPVVTVNGTDVDNFTIVDRTLTFTTAPGLDAHIVATYRAVSHDPEVTVNGTPLEAGDFVISGPYIVLDEPPALNAILEVAYDADSGSIEHMVEGSDQVYIYETDPTWSGSIEATVTVTCGGKWSETSPTVITDIRQPPKCSISPAGTIESGDGYLGNVLIALPLSVNVGGNGDSWELTLKTVNATTEPLPSGDRTVSAGTTVYTGTLSNTGQHDVISLPGTIVTGGQYTLECVCVDTATGLRSEMKSIGFTADWDVKAVAPSVSVVIDGDQAKITVRRGSGDSSSTLSIWRYTSDGAILCVNDAGDGVTYIDEVPPYQWEKSCYIAQSTTVDGDVCWVRGLYSLRGNGVTVDFDNKKVVLPFNIDFDDQYSNKFESRVHMDGARRGYFKPGVDRTGTASGAIPAENYEDTVMLLRQLGRYSGISFVRDVNGVAFPCHVNVNTSMAYMDVVRQVDLKFTEISDDGSWDLKSGTVPKDNENEEPGV